MHADSICNNVGQVNHHCWVDKDMGKYAGVFLELWDNNKRKEKLFNQKRYYLSRKVETLKPCDLHLLPK